MLLCSLRLLARCSMSFNLGRVIHELPLVQIEMVAECLINNLDKDMLFQAVDVLFF